VRVADVSPERGLLAVGLIPVFYPDVTPAEAATVVIPHQSGPELVEPPRSNGATGSPEPTISEPTERPGSPLPPTSER
jgi:hypothetical protein